MIIKRYKFPDISDLDLVLSGPTRRPWKDRPDIEDLAWELHLQEDPWRHFLLVKDQEPHYWSVHFRTGDTEKGPSRCEISEEQKKRLFEGFSRLIPKGDFLSTWGGLTPGGVHGLKRFKKYGFIEVGRRDAYMKTGEDIKIPILKKL